MDTGRVRWRRTRRKHAHAHAHGTLLQRRTLQCNGPSPSCHHMLPVVPTPPHGRAVYAGGTTRP